MRLRILVAAFPEGYRRLTTILAGHELVLVETMAQAQAAHAAREFDLAVIGTRFDESRMFELVRFLRSEEKTADLGIVCFRGILARPSEKVMVEGLALGCQAVGAVFHDFIGYPDDEAGNRAIREIFESHAAASRRRRE